MKDKEKIINKPSYHMLIAIRRKKDNDKDCKELVFRQIIRDINIDEQILKSRIKSYPGVWRIYHTVNARSHASARKLLMKWLIDFPEDSYRIDVLFKTFLLKKESKVTRNFLLDIDTNNRKIFNEIKDILLINKIKILIDTPTLNGYHLVTTKFDTRLLDNFNDVTILRDGYYLYDSVTIK